jgi:hypothetical protein
LLLSLKHLQAKTDEDASPKPLTPETAAEKVKEYLAEERHRIQLRDLIQSQGNDLASKITAPEFPASLPQMPNDQAFLVIGERIKRYEELTQVALSMMVTGCYNGMPTHDKLWVDLEFPKESGQGVNGYRDCS